ncbi:MAG TPA: NADPH-dependent FMN reductase [Burkholderiales bacterium]|jgi:FMN reductase|nr:NADPH-dependent FMN reductase [Burkholderiales bacterium]
MSIVTIAGSPSAESRSSLVVKYVAGLLYKHNIATTSISVRDLPAQDLVHGRYDSPAIKTVAGLIANARAIVVATPIYKASSAGVLKALLDLLPQDALRDKAVWPIGVGGSAAHLLAVDYSLKPVLVALGAQHLLSSFYATDKQIWRLESGEAEFDNDLKARLQLQVQQLADWYRQTTSEPAQRPEPRRLSAAA